jgi:cytochrome b6-f complex iron-sulfur subunit
MDEASSTGGFGMSTTRRTFVNRLMGTSLAAFAAALIAPVVGFLQPRESGGADSDVVVDPAGNPMDPASIPDGGGALGILAGEKVVVVRTGADSFTVLSATCTHLGCLVSYQRQDEELACPCHGGRYDLNGNVLGGPPPDPLRTMAVERDGEQLRRSGT